VQFAVVPPPFHILYVSGVGLGRAVQLDRFKNPC